MNFLLNSDYSIVLIILFFVIFLSLIIITLSYVIVLQQIDLEKISAYECGFQPFEETRTKFDVRFYLVAILFIIFDLEIMFLFPWCISTFDLYSFGINTMYFFLFLLIVGFIYEWKKGALDWS